MAAFCACCGAEINLKSEACAVCGTPRHGMLPKGASLSTAIHLDEKLEPQPFTNGKSCCSSLTR